MHKIQNFSFSTVLTVAWILIRSSTVSTQEELGNSVELFHNHDQSVKILHFPSEQTFIDKFGEDEQIAQIFNNYTISKSDPMVPGDMGVGFVIANPSEEIQSKIDEGYRTYSFNKFISDIIPWHRRLQDHRNEWCFTPNRFLKTLLPTTVVMCFYNEALSTLMRSVHSILEELQDQLESLIEKLPKVSLIRLNQREGLIRARIIGAEMAVAPVLTFLDSHVEVSEGWLEPLLDRVTRSWTTIAVPILDHLDRETFEYKASPSDARIVGGFTWDLLFAWKSPTKQDLKDVKTPADPFASPTMPGGLFSIHRDLFEHLSKFDDQFEVWGGENLELSFKAWLCGGRIEIVPCSRVAHLERGTSPYKRDQYRINTARLAAVWLDEYAEFYNANTANAVTDYGDISSRLVVKERLNCHSFDWYMNNIVPDTFNPKKALASGEVKNLAYDEIYCLDAHLAPNVTAAGTQPHLFWHCHRLGGNQYWYYSSDGEIRKDAKCLDYFGEAVTLMDCHGLGGNQNWEYHGDTGVIVHTSSHRCLTLDAALNMVLMSECQGAVNQKWKFQTDKFYQTFKDYDFEWRTQELLKLAKVGE